MRVRPVSIPRAAAPPARKKALPALISPVLKPVPRREYQGLSFSSGLSESTRAYILDAAGVSAVAPKLPIPRILPIRLAAWKFDRI